MFENIKNRMTALLSAGGAMLLSAGTALADDPGAGGSTGSSGILDFGALADQIEPILSTAIQAAAGVGILVLAATVCWRFFRRFISG